MQIARKLLFFAGFMLYGIAAAYSQIASVFNVDTVAAVAETPAGYATITGNNTLGSHSYIYASGYYNVQDGGAGFFTKKAGACSFLATGTVTSGQTLVTFTAPILFAVTRGMGIAGTGIPPGDTVDSFIATASGVSTVWLSQAATGSGTPISLTLDGGGGVNGGSIIADHSGNCFARTSAFTGNVREWGASCDVQVVTGMGTYAAGSMSMNSGTSPLNPLHDVGKQIVIPNIGTGVGGYYSVLPTSVPNGTQIIDEGSGYSIGDTVSFKSGGGATAAVEVSIMVDGLDGSGISALHFLNYGQYASPLTDDTLVQDFTSGGGSGAELSPTWLGATFADSIASVSGSVVALYSATPAIPASRDDPVGGPPNHGLNLWWYGHDDGAAINAAIAAAANGENPGISNPGPPQVFLPGKCGTTIPIVSSTANGAPILRGVGMAASGLYALAPIAGSVWQRPAVNTGNTGGGLADMTVEAGALTSDGAGNGLPAVGVYGGLQQTFSHLYVRDAAGTGNSNLRCGQNDWTPTGNLTSGSATITGVDPAYGAQILVGLTITDLTHSGNIPSGTRILSVSGNTIVMNNNAVVSASGDLLDIDPGANQGNGWFDDIRVESDQTAFTGPLLADMGFEAAHNCHDTFISHVVAVNAGIADAGSTASFNGVHWDHLHIFNQNYPDVPGSAAYGFESFGHDYVDFPQIDNARHASLYVGLPGPGSEHVGTRIVGAFLDCGKTATSVPPPAVVLTTGDFTIGSRTVTSVGTTAGIAVGDPINAGVLAPNTLVTGVTPTTIALSLPAASSGTTQTLTVSHGYQGIELAPLAKDVTVAATSTSPGCHMAPNQIVTQDGQADPSTQVLAPSSGSYATNYNTQANAVATTVFPTGSVTMQPTNYHACADTSLSANTITLPSPVAVGVVYSVDDCKGDANTNPITVLPASGHIDGSTSYTINTPFGSWSGYWTGSIWKTMA